MGSEELMDLIEGAKRGETEYLEKLYSVSYNRVYFYAFKIFGNTEDAADIVQDVFIIVFTKIKTLKEPLAYFNWLTKIVVNCCKQKQRKESKDRDAIISDEEKELATTIADESFSVEDIVEGHDIRSYVLGIIDILPEDQKRAVLLYYYEKLTLAQIAEVEEVAVATIKSRLHYAREKIKRAMHAEERRTGLRLYSFGAPALATVLQQSANICTLPVGIAQEIFYAVLAIVGVQTASNGEKAFNFVAYNDSEKANSRWKRIKSGIIVEVKPVKLGIIAAVIIIAVICGIMVPKYYQSMVDGSFGQYETARIDSSTTSDGTLTIKKEALPAAIRNKAYYYQWGFYLGKVDVTPGMAYLRTTKGGYHYAKVWLQNISDGMTAYFMINNTMLITVFDKDKNMIGYTTYRMTSLADKPKLSLKYNFKLNTSRLTKEVTSEVDSAFENAEVLTADDFYYDKNENGEDVMYLDLNKAPKDVKSVSCVSNVWTDANKSNQEDSLKSTVARYRMSKDVFSGDREIAKARGKNAYLINIYHRGELDIDNDDYYMPYNLVCLFDNGKLIAVAYLKDSEVKGSPSAK